MFHFSPDSEAMGFLLQITMSCPCALSRQVAGAVLVLGAGAGAGAVSLSWLCTWWRQVAGGAGCRCCVSWWRQVVGAGAGAGRRVPVLALCAGCARGGDRLLVPVLVLGAGCRR